MSVCKFCGAKCAESVFRDFLSAYYCGSWHNGAGQWSQGIACRDRCQEMLAQREATVEILRKRVAKAIEVARLQARWPSGEFIEVVEAKALDLVVEILEGKQ